MSKKSKNQGIHFKKEKCDGFTKSHVSKSKTIPDEELRNDEIDNLMLLANKAKSYDEALCYYDEILEKYDYYKAFNEKGFILIKLNEFKKAIYNFDQSLKLTKNNYDAYIGKVIAYTELLKLEGPINLNYELEIRANLRFADILNEESSYYYKFEFLKVIADFEGALKALNNYLEYNSDLYCNNPEKYFSLLLDKGILNFLSYGYYESFIILSQYLKFNENDTTALWYLAFTSIHLNRYDYALKCFDKIFEIDNMMFDAMVRKAELLISLHRYQEAIDSFEKCPIDEIPIEYMQLWNYANQLSLENKTNYFGVAKIYKNGQEWFVYAFVNNGFRKIYSPNLINLKHKLFINNDILLKKIEYAEDFTFQDYVGYYFMFPELLTEHNDVISSILNSDFIEKFNKGEINSENILKSKPPEDREFIKYLMTLIKKSLTLSHKKCNTGYFGVSKSDEGSSWEYECWGFKKYWGYVYTAETLNELESIVKEKNLFWFITDENLAKKSRKKDL